MTTTGGHRFSLLELIVVMVLLTIVAAVVVPRLSGYFQGRQVDDEARRLWALTRFAREQAIVRAVPMQLWIDDQAGQYGVSPMPGYSYAPAGRTYDLPAHVTMRLDDDAATLTWRPDGTLDEVSATAIFVVDSRREGDGWRITRLQPLSIFTLERGATP